jgi:hypothetical protein
MQQPFCFVDSNHIDKLTKKRMRRHVMMGKNAGRTIQRRSRKDIPTCQVTKAPAVSLVALCQQSQGDRFSPFDAFNPDSIYNNVLCGLSFPVKLTPHFAEVISNCTDERSSPS